MFLCHRNRRLAPNLLLHLKPVIDVCYHSHFVNPPLTTHHIQQVQDDVMATTNECPVCGDNHCPRHPIITVGRQDTVMVNVSLTYLLSSLISLGLGWICLKL